ncbi:MAG: hypothetical protein KAJ44_02055 [Thermoplasmatales archaeon]|nr:hypothetical protein [Thermoplasmatales archaeon]
MAIPSDVEGNWRNEVEKLFSHWEQETEIIKDMTIDMEECSRVSDGFHREWNGLLVRRPVGLTDDEVYTKLEKLDNKLNSTLAMACRSTEDDSI